MVKGLIAKQFHEAFLKPSNDSALLSEEYSQELLRALLSEPAAPDAPEYRLIASVWSLASLCFFVAPRIDPVSFLDKYVRWLQFYHPTQSAPDGDFVAQLNYLIAIRKFDKACVMLRSLLLERSNATSANEIDQAEMLLERLLEAPTPAQFLHRPKLWSDWIQMNCRLFIHINWSDSFVSAAMLISGGEVPKHQVNWLVFLGVEMLYKRIPASFHDIINMTRRIAAPTLVAHDKLMAAALTFDALSFTMNLQDLGDNLFGAHFSDLLFKSNLMPQSTRDSFVMAYAKSLSKEEWKIALDYLISCDGSGELLHKIIAYLDESELEECLLNYSHNQTISQLCSERIKILILERLYSREFEAAWKLAVASYYTDFCYDPILQAIVKDGYNVSESMIKTDTLQLFGHFKSLLASANPWERMDHLNAILKTRKRFRLEITQWLVSVFIEEGQRENLSEELESNILSVLDDVRNASLSGWLVKEARKMIL